MPHKLTSFRSFLLLPTLAVLLLLGACQKGDLGALNQESIVSTLSLVSITVTASNPASSPAVTTPVMPVGQQQQFNVTGTTDTGDIVSAAILNSKVTWTVSNSTIASLNSDGLLTALAPGTVSVTAFIGSLPNATADIFISAATANAISVTVNDANDPGNLSIRLCQSLQLKAEATYTDSNDPNITFMWDVTNAASWLRTDPADAATVIDATTPGLVAYAPETLPTAMINMNVDASITSIGVGKISLNVLYDTANFASLSIDPTISQLSRDTNAQLVATATRGSTDTDKITAIAYWTSSDNNIVSVNSSGLITGVTSGGPATITATCGGQSGAIDITVGETHKLERIEITKTGTNSSSGAFDLFLSSSSGATSVDLEAKAYYSDSTIGELITTLSATKWDHRIIDSPSGGSPVVVNNNDKKGKITSSVEGIAEVIVTFDSMTDDVIVIVKP